MEILVKKQVEKMKTTFNVDTLADQNFSENSPKEYFKCAEEDEEKEEKFNRLQTNKHIHGRRTIKIFGRFQKISRTPTFACNHA